jgi:hypothetical protein
LGGLVVGLFATMQATILLPALLLAGISCDRMRDRTTVRAALLGLFVLSMAIGPLILVVRNIHRGDGVGIAGNLGITMLVGAGGAGREIPCPMTDHSVESDRALTRCAIEYKLQHPVETAIVATDIEWKLWAPMVGPLARYGSWLHAFNYRRALPDSVYGSTWFESFDQATSKGWEIVTIGLIVAGVVLALRRERDRLAVVWMLVPIVAWCLMHSVIAGDARFRLPVSPFYTAFIAYAVVAVYDRIRRAPVAEPSES